MQHHLEHQNIVQLMSDIQKHRAQCTLQSRKPSHSTARLHELDRQLDSKYHQKISQIKQFIKRLTPLYLTFADKDQPMTVEQMGVIGNVDLRVSQMKRKYSLGRVGGKSEQKKQEYYNKWYIKPEQRFIEKKKEGEKISSQEYLQKILDGEMGKKQEANPFENTQGEVKKDKQKLKVDPAVIKKVAKSIEKHDKRIPVFFLPYLKK